MNHKHHLRVGFTYSAFSKYFNTLNQFITTTILARILSPSDFGTATVVLVFLSFFYLLSNFGLGPGIIQKRDLTDKDISTVFFITIIIGVIFSIVFFQFGPLLADNYNEPEYTKISKLLSLSLFFHTINMVPYNLSLKQLKFKEIAVSSSIISFSGGILAIALAIYDFKYYSLIYRAIFEAILYFIVNFKISKIKIVRVITFTNILQIFRFSFFQFLFTVIDNLSKNIDSLLIGKYLGPTKLGFYDRSYRLMSAILGIASIFTSVIHPVLSKEQDNKSKIFTLFKKFIKYLFIIFFPLSTFLFFSSKEIILLLYGLKWLGSIESFKYFSLFIITSIMLSLLVPFLQVLGKTKILFIGGLIYLIFISVAVIVGTFVFKSYNCVAFLIFINISILLLPFYLYVIKKLFQEKFKDIFISLIPGLLIGLINILVNFLFNIISYSNPLIINLFVRILILLIISIFLLNKLGLLKEIVNLVKSN